MSKVKRKKPVKEVRLEDILDNKRLKVIDEHVKAHYGKQTKEQLLRKELAAIRYRMIDYLEDKHAEKEMKPIDFFKMYLHILNVSQNKIATYFDIKASNMHKYLTGERKLNVDFVLKLSRLFQTDPEIWYHIEIKNEIRNIQKTDWEKYDNYSILHVLDNKLHGEKLDSKHRTRKV